MVKFSTGPRWPNPEVKEILKNDQELNNYFLPPNQEYNKISKNNYASGTIAPCDSVANTEQ